MHTVKSSQPFTHAKIIKPTPSLYASNARKSVLPGAIHKSRTPLFAPEINKSTPPLSAAMMINSAHHDDDDPRIFPREGIFLTGESNWCVVCGHNSKKKRKRQTCNTYENSNHTHLLKTLRKVLRRKMNGTLSSRIQLNYL